MTPQSPHISYVWFIVKFLGNFGGWSLTHIRLLSFAAIPNILFLYLCWSNLRFFFNKNCRNPCPSTASKAIKRLGVPKCGAVRKPPLKSRPGFNEDQAKFTNKIMGKCGKNKNTYHLRMTWGWCMMVWGLPHHILWRSGTESWKVRKTAGLRDIVGWN